MIDSRYVDVIRMAEQLHGEGYRRRFAFDKAMVEYLSVQRDWLFV